MRYFGTDGVRATINSGSMTAENLVRLALAAGLYFMRAQSAKSHPRPLVVIGKDTRLSGYMVEAALQAGFASIGMDTRLLGPLPTPAVGHLTRSLRADLGVMISASHNPHYDNGVKLFGADGFKLPDAVEDEIAKIIPKIIQGQIPLAEPQNLGRAKRMLDGLGRYVEQVKTVLPRGLRLGGVKVVVDCAHGAAYRAAPDVLFELGAEVIPLAVAPDGLNINADCGAMHPQNMAAAVVEHGADVGLAFDGDADRLIMADEKGQLINGDQCLAVIADVMQKRGLLKGAHVVGTLMTNHGLEGYLADLGLGLIRTQVGDRYILEALKKQKLNLGGEPSGHILMTDYATSGDGLMSGLMMLSALVEGARPASATLHRFPATPQMHVNLAAKSHEQTAEIIGDKKLAATIAAAEADLGTGGRVVVRASGTEPLLRIMVESTNPKAMQSWAEQLKDVVEAQLEV